MNALPAGWECICTVVKLLPRCKTNGIIIYIYVGKRFPKMNFVIFNPMSGEPLQCDQSLFRHDLPNVTRAAFHMATGAYDDVMSFGPPPLQFIKCARDRFHLCVRLTRFLKLANNAIEVYADAHEGNSEEIGSRREVKASSKRDSAVAYIAIWRRGCPS